MIVPTLLIVGYRVQKGKLSAYLREQEELHGSLEALAKAFSQRVGEPVSPQKLHNWREGKYKTGLSRSGEEVLRKWFFFGNNEASTELQHELTIEWLNDLEENLPPDRLKGYTATKQLSLPMALNVKQTLKESSLAELLQYQQWLTEELRIKTQTLLPIAERFKAPSRTLEERLVVFANLLEEFVEIQGEDLLLELAEEEDIPPERLRELRRGALLTTPNEIQKISRILSKEPSMKCTPEQLLDICNKLGCRVVEEV